MKYKVEKLYLLFLSFFWIGLFFYFRFLQSRQSYSLLELKSNTTFFIITMNVLFIFMHLIIIAFVLIKLQDNISLKINNNSILTKFKYFYDLIFNKPFEHLHNKIAPRIPGSGKFFVELTTFFEHRFEKQDVLFFKLPVIFFNFIPRIFVALIFFIELLIFNRIYYFIPCLFFLLIPILWNICLKLYISFAERGLRQIPSYIKIIPKGTLLANGWYTEYNFEPLTNYKYKPGDVHEYGKLYIKLMHAYSFGMGQISFMSFQQNLLPYIILINSSLYFSAGCFKLFFLVY